MDETYTDDQARRIMAIAARDNQHAKLLNTLADGGMITWEQDKTEHVRLVFVDGATTRKFMEQLNAG